MTEDTIPCNSDSKSATNPSDFASCESATKSTNIDNTQIDELPSDFEGSDLSSIHSDTESPPSKILRPSTPPRRNQPHNSTKSPFKSGRSNRGNKKTTDTIYAKDINLDHWPLEEFVHSPRPSSLPRTPTKRSKPKPSQSSKTQDTSTSNINKRNRAGRTKLFRAVEKGDLDQCKELVESGADVTLRDNGGWGLIHIASGKGHLEVANYLIEKGAPINVSGLYGQTPLHDAAQINHFDLVKLLLVSGANIGSRDCQGNTALDMAEDEDIINFIKQVLNDIHKNEYRDEKGQTSLHLACIQGDEKLVNKCLDEGSDINAKDKEGWTSLHRAALYGHADIVNELIVRSAQINALGFLGDTPLHDACYNNHFDIVELLLQNGADPFICNDNDQFPLHVATDSEVQRILKEFVDRPKVTTLRRNAKRALQFKEHSPVNHLLAAVDRSQSGTPERSLPRETQKSTDLDLNPISTSGDLTSLSDISELMDPIADHLDTQDNEESKDTEIKLEFSDYQDCKISDQPETNIKLGETTQFSPHSPELFSPHSPPDKPPKRKKARNNSSSKDLQNLKSTLYMVSIPLADDPSTLFVVDLQVQLVLDMTLPEEGLISLYPYLYRRQVTKPEKERLWKHFRRILEPLIEISTGKVEHDQKIGKKDFLKLVMNFVKMDEIVDLIKDKYGNLSSNIITIELDLGYKESATKESHNQPDPKMFISPASIDSSEKPTIISPECNTTENPPIKREPSSSLDFILGPTSPKRITSPRIPSLKNILDNPDILNNAYSSSAPTSPVQSPNGRMPPKLARKLKHRNSMSDHGRLKHD